jgi:hypothetical protein
VRKSSFTRGRGNAAGTPEEGGGEPPTIRDNNTIKRIHFKIKRTKILRDSFCKFYFAAADWGPEQICFDIIFAGTLL